LPEKNKSSRKRRIQMRNKSLLFLVAACVLLGGCASTGKKDVDGVNKRSIRVPPDTPDTFLKRYYFLIEKKTKICGETREKEFKLLATEEEKQKCIDEFWTARDPDPMTPVNEYKETLDDRIADIESEILVTVPFLGNTTFGSNGGYRGEMAQVYLIHGLPDYTAFLEEGSYHVSLMLWLYVNPENGRHKYRFLFYEDYSMPPFSLLRFQNGALTLGMTIAEISRMPTIGAQWTPIHDAIVREIRYSQDGMLFLAALFEFSDYSNMNVSKALKPPKSMKEFIDKEDSKIHGQTDLKDLEVRYSSCDGCLSSIPLTLRLQNGKVLAKRSDLDWIVKDDQILCELWVMIQIRSHKTGVISYLNKNVQIKSVKDSLEKFPSEELTIRILTEEELMYLYSTGRYDMQIYVKNVHTFKYNAWSLVFGW
jgi:GWxTD domain-containing protein